MSLGFKDTWHGELLREVLIFASLYSAMRKSGPVLYIMPGYSKAAIYLDKLGPHKLGKSCLYVKRLTDIDMQVLEDLIVAGLNELNETHAVRLV